MQDIFDKDTWVYMGDISDMEIWGSGLRRALVIRETGAVHLYYGAPSQRHAQRLDFSPKAKYLANSAIRNSMPV